MKSKPLLEPSSEAVMAVCPVELDKLLFVSDAISTSSSSTCAATAYRCLFLHFFLEMELDRFLLLRLFIEDSKLKKSPFVK